MSEEWLRDWIVLAESQKLCMKRVCTTCGAWGFKAGVLRRMGKDAHPREFQDPATHRDLAAALADLQRDPTIPSLAVMCLLMEMWDVNDSLRNELEVRLSGSWAGEILESMQRHYRREVEQDVAYAAAHTPEAIASRREAKSAIRRAAHAERLAKKTMRDQEWRASQTGLIASPSARENS